MWKNQGSWNFFHAKLIPNSSIIIRIMRINPFPIIAFKISIVVIYYVKNKVKKPLTHNILHAS